MARGLGVTLLFIGATAHSREYPDLFPTAQALAMGRAVTATARGVTALQFNPAGLAANEKGEFRAPDLAMVQGSRGIQDLRDTFKDAKNRSGDPVAKQLQRYDGMNASFGVDLLGVSYTRRRFGIAINPSSVNTTVRVRTPSLLFVKADAKLINDTGVALGYGHPFFKNHLRLGATLRPFIWRTGFDAHLENRDVVEIFSQPDTSERLKTFAGSGWGTDFDVGMQANTNPFFPVGAKVHWGLAFQNAVGTEFTNEMGGNTLTGKVPPLQQKINVGTAVTFEKLGRLQPTLSFEIRDILVRTDKFVEHVHSGFELLLQPKKWLSTAFRGHFYKGNIGGGIGNILGPAELEIGSYAVNLGNGPGISVNRRYYSQLSLVF